MTEQLQVVLDREIRFDEQSKDYPIRELVGGKFARGYTWRYFQLNQNTFRCGICKQFGACTGYSAAMEAAARPKPVFGDPLRDKDKIDRQAVEKIAHEVYHRAKQIDEWAGESYEGSSVLGAAKAGREKGWWSEFRWALGPGPEKAAQDVILALGYAGPVMLGSWWRSGMWKADDRGFLRYEGEREGGHAWLATRYSKNLDAIWTPNSWGGQGQGWISRKDLIKLLDEDGEACIPVQRELPKP